MPSCYHSPFIFKAFLWRFFYCLEISAPLKHCVFAIGVFFTVGTAQVSSFSDLQLKGRFDHRQICFPVRVTVGDAKESGYILRVGNVRYSTTCILLFFFLSPNPLPCFNTHTQDAYTDGYVLCLLGQTGRLAVRTSGFVLP